MMLPPHRAQLREGPAQGSCLLNVPNIRNAKRRQDALRPNEAWWTFDIGIPCSGTTNVETVNSGQP